MNGMNQQGYQGFQANNQFSNNQQSNQNQFQPSGFVQSHYQGNIPTQNAGPVISHLGYQANNQQQQQHAFSRNRSNQT